MIAALAALTPLPALAETITGQASVIDGDTLEIHGQRIRLSGIDAPESDQLCRGDDSLQYRCGAKAANALDDHIAGRPVSCEGIGGDQYGRTVAVCSIDGEDLATWLVRNGFAFDWPRYSKGKYTAAQKEAERAGRGSQRPRMRLLAPSLKRRAGLPTHGGWWQDRQPHLPATLTPAFKA